MKIYTILFVDEEAGEIHVMPDAYLSMDEAIAAANEDWESNWGKDWALTWELNVGKTSDEMISYRVDEVSVANSLAKQQRAAAKKKAR